MGDFTTAAHQFGYALLLRPNRSEIADKLHLALRFAAQSSNASSQLKAIASSPPDSPPLLNQLAWLFATHPDAARRDGPRAVQLSERACALTERKQAAFLTTGCGRLRRGRKICRSDGHCSRCDFSRAIERRHENGWTGRKSSQRVPGESTLS
jgi:hypothetical protein